MDIPEELRQEIMATFQIELEEHLGALNKGLLALEKDPSPEEQTQLLADLFRTAHNLKGSARAVGLKDIVAISDSLEDLLSALQEGVLSPSSELLDIMLPAVDALEDAMAAHLKGEKLPVKQRESLLETLKAALKGDMPARKDGGTAGSGRAKRPKTRKAPEPVIPIEEEAPEPQHSPPPSPPEPDDPGPRIQSRPAEPEPEIPQADPAKVATMAGSAICNPQSEDTIRVATAKLDTLMDGMGELLVARMSNEQRLTELRTIQDSISRWQKSWRQVRIHYNYLLRQKSRGSPITASGLPFTNLRIFFREI